MFELKIRTDDAAFADGEKPVEVARILREIAAKVDDWDGYEGLDAKFQTVFDVNGNDVGRWKLS